MKKSLWGLVLERAIVVMAKIFLQINYIWRHLKDILNVCWKLASGLWRKEGSFPKEPRWLERWSGGVIYVTSCNQEVSSLSLSLHWSTALLCFIAQNSPNNCNAAPMFYYHIQHKELQSCSARCRAHDARSDTCQALTLFNIIFIIKSNITNSININIISLLLFNLAGRAQMWCRCKSVLHSRTDAFWYLTDGWIKSERWR